MQTDSELVPMKRCLVKRHERSAYSGQDSLHHLALEEIYEMKYGQRWFGYCADMRLVTGNS